MQKCNAGLSAGKANESQMHIELTCLEPEYKLNRFLIMSCTSAKALAVHPGATKARTLVHPGKESGEELDETKAAAVV